MMPLRRTLRHGVKDATMALTMNGGARLVESGRRSQSLLKVSVDHVNGSVV